MNSAACDSCSPPPPALCTIVHRCMKSDTRHLLRSSLWNEGGKMSGRQKVSGQQGHVRHWLGLYLEQQSQGEPLIIVQCCLTLLWVWTLRLPLWLHVLEIVKEVIYAYIFIFRARQSQRYTLCNDTHAQILLYSPPLNLCISCSMNGLAFTLV